MTKTMKWLSVTMLLLAVFVSIALSGRDVLWLNGIGLAAFLMAALAFDGRPARRELCRIRIDAREERTDVGGKTYHPYCYSTLFAAAPKPIG